VPAKRKKPNREPDEPEYKKVSENLYRRQTTGTYYGLLKRGGKQFRRSLKTKDRKLAERHLADLKEELADFQPGKDSDASFDRISDRWMVMQKGNWKPSTLKRRKTCVANLKPFFKGVVIRKISPKHCEEWVIRRGGGIAAQTFAHELSTMKGVFDYAVSNGLMLKNPAAGIKRRKIVQDEIEVPTRAQFKALVDAIRHSDGRADSQKKAKGGADLVELLAYSGCRLAEGTSLRWKDTDFKRNRIIVRGGDDGTKNSVIRAVPLTASLRGLLERLKSETTPDPDDLIINTKSARKCMETACRRLEYPNFTHHDLRHFFATTCIEAGIDIPTISQWLGHKDGGALAMKVYGHLRDEHSEKMIAKVSFD
jgi:integrase